jgi:hypothetical protein
MYAGETDMINAINNAANGINTDTLNEGLAKTKENIDNLSNTDLSSIKGAADNLGSMAEATGNLGNSSSTAATGIKDISESTKGIADTAGTASEGITGIGTALNGIDTTKINTLKDEFNKLKVVINDLVTLFGSEGGTEGLIGGLSSLFTPEKLENIALITNQFTELKNAIAQASMAIGGGGTAETSEMPSATGSGGGTGAAATGGAQGGTNNAQSGSASSLSGALKQQVEEAKTLIPEEIALFNGEEDSLLAGVTDVIEILAGGEESTGEGKETDPNTLMGANMLQVETAKEILPEEIQLFNDLREAIASCVTELQLMVALMEGTEGISMPSHGGGGYSRSSSDFTGNANAHGTWGSTASSKTLTGELGRELVVRGNKFFTVGDHGAEFADIRKGDIVFNHRQTESLLKYGKINSRGHALANGNYTPLEKADPDKFALLSQIGNISKELRIGSNNLNRFNSSVEESIHNINSIKNIKSSQDININIGDIQLSGVQDVNGLANAITAKLPGMLVQSLTKR